MRAGRKKHCVGNGRRDGDDRRLATAGGCEIVLSADMVVASTRSAFGLAEAKRNLIAGAGGLFRLPRIIGRNVAMEVILTG